MSTLDDVDFEPGDTVSVRSGILFLGSGIVTAVHHNAKQASVETFDGCHYTVPISDLEKIEN